MTNDAITKLLDVVQGLACDLLAERVDQDRPIDLDKVELLAELTDVVAKLAEAELLPAELADVNPITSLESEARRGSGHFYDI